MDQSLFATNSLGLWIGFNLFILALLAFDLGVFNRRGHETSTRQAIWLSIGYVAMSGVFAGLVFYTRGAEAGWQFTTGYLIEKSLSLDNVFVFVLIFSHFAVPKAYQHRILFWGILGALVMRAALIFAGTALIQEFHWVIYLFAAFLVLTGLKMLFASDSEPNPENSLIVRLAKRTGRVTDRTDGDRFFIRQNGVLFATPLFLVLLMIEASDLIFALDSIPAIFAVTTDPFLVYTCNVFAILGLRALYLVLADVVHKFRYLKQGLALVLVVVGTKMLLNAWFEAKIIPTEAALAVTGLLIGGSILLSWLRPEAPKAPVA
jgi:tellurite resistance protein TerC